MSKWIKWRRRLLKKCRSLIRKYPNLAFLPQSTNDVIQQDWKEFFDEEMSVDDAIDEVLSVAGVE